MCNAYGHENTRAYRNLQQLALRLAAAGFDVLRFDYHGTGNSSGSCEECRAESFRADTRHMAQYLQEVSHCSRLSVVGVRLGATIAATADLPNVEQLLLWDPVVDARMMLSTFQHLQDYALTSQNRFARVIPSPREELYGHACSEQKLSSLSSLKLPSKPMPGGVILTSDGYRATEPRFASLKGWEVHETSDAIHWHDPLFTESAFASPDAFRMIHNLLYNCHAPCAAEQGPK
ncbi:MAG: alpha/beta hydrolase [Pirellulaceae bacterium]